MQTANYIIIHNYQKIIINTAMSFNGRTIFYRCHENLTGCVAHNRRHITGTNSMDEGNNK